MLMIGGLQKDPGGHQRPRDLGGNLGHRVSVDLGLLNMEFNHMDSLSIMPMNGSPIKTLNTRLR